MLRGRALIDAVRSDIHAGLRADRSGKWLVAKLEEVWRPRRRVGKQLQVLVRFAGVDPITGQPWADEWLNVTWLTGDLRREAREMEAAKYGRLDAERGGDEGTRKDEPARKSPRLAEVAPTAGMR